MSSYLFPVQSDPAVNFLEGLTQYQATPINTLYGVQPIFSRRYLIRAITITTKENYGPQLNFFSTGDGDVTDPADNTFISRWGFLNVSGQQVGATGLWQYYVDGLAIPYYDAYNINDQTGQNLYVSLENTSTTAKSAADTGATKVVVWMEAMKAGSY